MEPRLKMITFR